MNDKLIGQMADILECETDDINDATPFRELPSWDSLAYMSVIAMIDAEFGVVIPQERFRELKTIGDIAAYIKSNMNE